MHWFIVGTRPEAIKLRPLVRVLARRRMPFRVVATGQHADLLAGTGLRPTTTLQLPSQNDPEGYVAACQQALEALTTRDADTILVQGDTASALAGAQWGCRRGLRVVHVEAGLRSGDLNDPWPEEGFRRAIDGLATLNCCPTEANRANLVAEKLDGVVTGNPITDALRLRKLHVQPLATRYLVLTLHRRESFGATLAKMVAAIGAWAADHPDWLLFWPLHPNPRVHEALIPLPTNVLLRGPMPVDGFLALIAGARGVLTDSGGLIEETLTLGVPCAVARNVTERPEAFAFPSHRLLGTSPEGILTGLDFLTSATASPQSTFGDGHAADRIADLL